MSEELKPCPFCGHSIDIEKVLVHMTGANL